jgi:hypothetical protein
MLDLILLTMSRTQAADRASIGSDSKSRTVRDLKARWAMLMETVFVAQIRNLFPICPLPKNCTGLAALLAMKRGFAKFDLFPSAAQASARTGATMQVHDWWRNSTFVNHWTMTSWQQRCLQRGMRTRSRGEG